MKLENKNIAFCLTSSFGTFKNIILQMKELIKEKANIIPIMSYNAYKTDSKFGNAKEFIKEIEKLTERKIIHTIEDIELFYPRQKIDIMIIAPCSENTLAKLSNGIADTPVLYATKIHLKIRKSISYMFIC